jgi:hypothetical protein
VYPKPDRSGYAPNFRKTDENPSLDIGWSEGVLGDGRPYRVECWAEDGITMLTFFLSAQGLETWGAAELAALLAREGLVAFKQPAREVGLMRFIDSAGNDLWSINVTVGSGDEIFIGESVPVQPYDRH